MKKIKNIFASDLKKPIVLLLLFLFSCRFCYAQTDTIFSTNEKISCSVKEVTPLVVKYSFPGEDAINTIYKNTVKKIIFKSGRVQTFAEVANVKDVSNVMDFDNVTITIIESDILGLKKIRDLSSTTKGSIWKKSFDQETIKQMAFHRLKIQAAMFGSNAVFVTRQNFTIYSAYVPGIMYLDGIAYTNKLPNIDEFKKIYGNQTSFLVSYKYSLGPKDNDVVQKGTNKSFRLLNVTKDDGVIYLDGILEDEKKVNRFQLVNFNPNNFSIAYKDEDTIYNLVVKL